MTWWKVSYDFQRPNWQAFGHIAFVDAETREDAHTRAAMHVARVEPGATVTRLTVTPATDGEHARFLARVAARDRWLANVAAGIPNPRGTL